MNAALLMDAMWGLSEKEVSTPRFLAEADIDISSFLISMLGDGGWGGDWSESQGILSCCH